MDNIAKTDLEFLLIEILHFKMKKLATIVEDDPKAPFSIATTLRCMGWFSPIPRLFHFTLDTYIILLSVKQGSIKYHFKRLWYDVTWD